MTRCKVCQVTVKDENLAKHMRNSHPKVPFDAPRQTRPRQPLTRGSKKILGIIAVVVAVAVLVAVLYRGVPSSQPFPCVTGSLAYHWHTQLTITDSGGNVVIPANTGYNLTCAEPVHTHDTSGTIHVESDTSRLYTVGNFFTIWGKSFGSPSSMLVNGTATTPSAGQVLWDHGTISLTYAGAFP